MNHGHLKHLKRLMVSKPPEIFNPFDLSISGLRVVASPDTPRYQMPEWLVEPTDDHDGVRWPAKFRAETNEWALRVCGTTNVVPRGTAYVLAGGYAVMRPSDVVKISNICA